MTYQQMYWRPIATAPTEDCMILAYVPDNPAPGTQICIVEGPPDRVDGSWCWSTHEDLISVWPTHWMPLPESPGGSAGITVLIPDTRVTVEGAGHGYHPGRGAGGGGGYRP